MIPVKVTVNYTKYLLPFSIIPCDICEIISKLFGGDVKLYLVVVMDNDRCTFNKYKILICDSTKHILGKIVSAYLRLDKYVDIDFLKKNNKNHQLHFNFTKDDIFVSRKMYNNEMYDMVRHEFRKHLQIQKESILSKLLCCDITGIICKYL